MQSQINSPIIKQKLAEIKFNKKFSSAYNINFQAWTFAEATRVLNLLSEVLPANQQKDLENIVERIGAFNEIVRTISTSDKTFIDEENVDEKEKKENKGDTDTIDINLKKYFNQIKESNNVALVQAVSIYHYLSKLYQKIINSEDKNSDKEFENLLICLMNCCYGVVHSLNSTNDLIKIKSRNLKAFSDFARETLSGAAKPFSQGLDPLRGSSVRQEGFKDFLGGCSGYIHDWTNQIILGNTTLSLSYDAETHDLQTSEEKIKKIRHNSLNIDIDFDKSIDSMMAKIKNGNIFHISITNRRRETAPGHLMGIRYIASEKTYEFFDPNIGIYTFKNASDMKEFFKVIMAIYLITADLNTATLIEIPKTSDKNKFSFIEPPKIDMQKKDISSTIFTIIIEALKKIYTEDSFLLEQLQSRLISRLPTLLKHITSISTLDEILLNFKKELPEFFTGEKASTPKLFKKSIMLPNHLQLENLFNKRKEELQVFNSKLSSAME